MPNKQPKQVLIPLDEVEVWKKLSNEEAGELVKALLHFAVTGNSVIVSEKIDLIYLQMCLKIKRDQQKYADICDKNQQNALKRWNANESDRMRSNAVDANRNRNEIESESDKGKTAIEGSKAREDQQLIDFNRRFDQKYGGAK